MFVCLFVFLTLRMCPCHGTRLPLPHTQKSSGSGFFFALTPVYIYIYISAVKRLKYLIAINRIYVIVNSKLIAINRKFVSILNVPSFIHFFHNLIFILMPLPTWKSGLACFMQMFYFIENQHCQTGRYKIKL